MVLHPSTSRRNFLRLIIVVDCCRHWRMGGMLECSLLDQPGLHYPGLPLPALMGGPGALVAGPVFLKSLAEQGNRQVYSGQRSYAPGLVGLRQKRAYMRGVDRDARADRIPPPSPRPYHLSVQINSCWVELQVWDVSSHQD